MKAVKNVTLLGAGAIGAAYASMINDADPSSPVIVADGERFERYRSEGIVVNGKTYRFPLARPQDETGPADLVLVCVKAHQLQAAIRDMRGRVGEDTVILSLLNGISSEKIIGGAFGMEKMLYGMVVEIDAVRTGNSVTFTKKGCINFGEPKNAALTPRVRAVKEFFDRSGVPCKVPEDMIKTLYWKFMLNVGVNQASAILRAPYGVFQRISEARDLMDLAMREVAAVAAAEGVLLNEDDLRNAHVPVSKLSPEGKTSMLQDIEAGRKTEVDLFAGTVLELGKKHGIPTPVNETLYLMIKTIEAGRPPEPA